MNLAPGCMAESVDAPCTSMWASYRVTADDPWNLCRVVHLYRRAAFGATWSEIQQAVQDGPQVTLDRLLSGGLSARSPKGYRETSRLLAESAVAARHPVRLKAAWIYRLLFSPDPLGEQLTLMWHNHFATSNLKVDDPGLMWRQNETLRRLARAPFGDLLRTMLRDPALLIWLDAPTNRKGAPNENLARELLELFTLGTERGRESFFAGESGSVLPDDSLPQKKTPDPFGHYTEADVKETARALTGWSVEDGQFCEMPEHHDDGSKTILGKTGSWRADDIAEILLDHPATASRIAWRICDHFLGEGVASDEEIDALAAGLRERDLNVGWAVETVLRSARFFDQENLDTRIVPPVDYILSAVRSLELAGRTASPAILADWLAELGQDLFYPPNVGGWPGGRAWLSPRTLVSRARFAAELTNGRLGRPTRPVDVQPLARQNGFGTSPAEALDFLSQLVLGRHVDQLWSEQLLNGLNDSPQHGRLLLARLLSSPLAHLG